MPQRCDSAACLQIPRPCRVREEFTAFNWKQLCACLWQGCRWTPGCLRLSLEFAGWEWLGMAQVSEEIETMFTSSLRGCDDSSEGWDGRRKKGPKGLRQGVIQTRTSYILIPHTHIRSIQTVSLKKREVFGSSLPSVRACQEMRRICRQMKKERQDLSNPWLLWYLVCSAA